MSVLFQGKFCKVSQEEKIILNKDGKEDGRYLVVSLSNGEKTFEVTCGTNSDLAKIPVFNNCNVNFDVIDKKLKVVGATGIAKGGERHE